MLLGEILHSGVVKLNLNAKNKDEAIEELVDLLVEGGAAPSDLRQHLLDVVMERERTMSTGMDHGVALPHASSDQVNQIIGALGSAPEGIPFNTLDGEPARLLILLILPRHNFQGHVRTLAGIAHLLSNPGFRESIIEAPDPNTVLEIIYKAEHENNLFNNT
ncbi:MAG: PTS sugar transporter subunit IIA [Candidatus Hydrogenedentota bacterium]